MPSLRLRPWQKAALERFHATASTDFLCVATPGAGKTTFALTAAVQDLALNPHQRVIVVTPTQHLKAQWAAAAGRFGLQLHPTWAPRHGGLPADAHGIVTTFQQIASAAAAVAPMATDAFVILDEVHHAGDERAWGDGLRRAFAAAGRRLSVSGTPFRSDTNSIPFVRYEEEEAVADFSYGYGDALDDGGVVRPVFFPRIDGHMEWSAPDGSLHSHSFDDVVTNEVASQRLRTALSPDGEWLPTVLRRAHERLLELRRDHPEAAGVVITTDQEHARAVSRIMRQRLRVRPVVATSDDPRASGRISGFAAGTEPWIVAVRMVSEGVDIPRLRVGVYATSTSTELFFRQAVGRLVRWIPGMPRQKAFLFVPDDPRFRVLAHHIAEERRHSLRKRQERMDRERDPDLVTATVGEDGQLAMFEVISAVALGEEETSIFSDRHREDLVHLDDLTYDPDLEIALTPPPLPDGSVHIGDAALHDERDRLRRVNQDRVAMLVLLTGEDHATVNATLNRETGIRSVAEATVGQLDRRVHLADRWLARL
ncbi:MAG: DEAD/DEAH box helicase family protein [Actinobacteria bacterium]|nr:DEAD/DEAH box helicase family protein [Actinomycetota bacterium]